MAYPREGRLSEAVFKPKQLKIHIEKLTFFTIFKQREVRSRTVQRTKNPIELF